jgi:hypothetical protein
MGPLHKFHIVGDVLWLARKCFISSKYIGFNIVCTLDSRACHRHLLPYNNTTKENNDTLPSFSSSLTLKRRQRHKLRLPFSLQHHQRRKKSQQIVVTFFDETPP